MKHNNTFFLRFCKTTDRWQVEGETGEKWMLWPSQTADLNPAESVWVEWWVKTVLPTRAFTETTSLWCGSTAGGEHDGCVNISLLFSVALFISSAASFSSPKDEAPVCQNKSVKITRTDILLFSLACEQRWIHTRVGEMQSTHTFYSLGKRHAYTL